MIMIAAGQFFVKSLKLALSLTFELIKRDLFLAYLNPR